MDIQFNADERRGIEVGYQYAVDQIIQRLISLRMKYVARLIEREFNGYR